MNDGLEERESPITADGHLMVVNFSIYINLKKQKVFHNTQTYEEKLALLIGFSSPLRLSDIISTDKLPE